MLLQRILHWIVVGGVFALPFIPLIIAHGLFFPFITGKNFTFRIVVEIITAAWLALALVDTRYRPQRSWLLAAFAIFVLVIGVADAFGANAFKSFWSNFERMEGWVTLAHLFAYFTVAISVLKTENIWRRLLQTSLGVSLLVSLYSVLQLIGFITINQGGVRVDATFGNATYLAVYLLFHIFIAALIWGQTWRESTNRLLPSVLYGGLTVLQTLILLFTATRGAILGVVGGALLMALLLAFFGDYGKQVRRMAGAAVAIILVLIGGFFLLRGTTVADSLGPVSRVVNISLEEKTVQSRFMNWGMAWEGVKERPLLGWGQENYNLVFNKYYNPQMYGQEQWFDRVHNIFFDWLIAGGVLGLLAYLSLFAIALYYLWFREAFTPFERATLTGLLAAYGFHNLFVFDNIVSYILFATVLGYITARVMRARDVPPLGERTAPIRVLPVFAVVAVVLAWGLAWGVNANALAANRALLQAVAPQEAGIQKNLEYFEEAISYGSYGTQEAREQLAQGTARLAGNENVPQEARQQFLESARDEMQKQMEAAPKDARFPLFLGTLLDAYGLHGEAQEPLALARDLSPTKQAILFQAGLNALARGADAEALEIFRTAFELAPAFDEARYYYAATLIRNDQVAQAQEILAPLREDGPITDARIINAYAAIERYDEIIGIWEARLAENPNNVQAIFALSATYYQAGQPSKAIELLQQAAEDYPGVAQQAQTVIEQIRSGTTVVGQ